MKRIVLIFIAAVCFLPLQAFSVPEKLQNKIDATTQAIDGALLDGQNFVNTASQQISDDAVTLSQKDAKTQKKLVQKNTTKGRKLLKAIRKRLKQLRQNPNFDETTDEINELEDVIEMVKEDITNLNGLKKTIGQLQSDLNFPNKKTQAIMTQAAALEATYIPLEERLDVILSSGAECQDRNLLETIQAELQQAKKIVRLARKRLNPLFQNLNKTAEIRAIQKTLKRAKEIRKKYQQALRDINKLTDEECNNVEIVQTIAGIECTFFGQIQDSGFGTATFTCIYPDSFNSGRLELTIIHPDTNQIVDYGFASINFVNSSPKSLRIDPCPGSLPVCEEAVLAVRAVQTTSAKLIVTGNGNTIGELTYTLNE